MRRIIRLPKSKFKIGDRVRVESHYNGPYYGHVIFTHRQLTKTASSKDDTQLTKPGVTVKCTWWDGIEDNIEIVAWDDETALCDEIPSNMPG